MRFLKINSVKSSISNIGIPRVGLQQNQGKNDIQEEDLQIAFVIDTRAEIADLQSTPESLNRQIVETPIMSEPFIARFQSSCSNFCSSLRGQYSSIIMAFSAPQVRALASTMPIVCTCEFHQERAACMYVQAANLTWQSAVQLLIWKTDSVFSNQRVSSMTPPVPAKLWGLQFMKSLYEHGLEFPPFPPGFPAPPPPPLLFLGLAIS
ncbi:hypothetical protein LXL04_020247 [Taraxacum kok-saghyz]